MRPPEHATDADHAEAIAAAREAGHVDDSVPIARRRDRDARSTTATSSSPRSRRCTNTSNPSVMLAAGLLARNAVARGLTLQAVGEDVARAGLEGRHGVPRPRRA